MNGGGPIYGPPLTFWNHCANGTEPAFAVRRAGKGTRPYVSRGD